MATMVVSDAWSLPAHHDGLSSWHITMLVLYLGDNISLSEHLDPAPVSWGGGGWKGTAGNILPIIRFKQ